MKKKSIIGGVSVIGTSHTKTKTPNQDNIKVLQKEDIIVICVSDGHGGEAYIRSDIGSKTAVEVASNELYKFLKESQVNEETLISLKENILNLWEQQVTEHCEKHPISIKKQQIHDITITGSNNMDRSTYYLCLDQEKQIKFDSYQKLIKKPLIAYEATLLCVGMTLTQVVTLGIGDGDIRFTYNEQKIINPLPVSTELIGNMTYSLCDQYALKHFHHSVTEEVPMVIVISTDGIANSFIDESTLDLLGLELRKEYISKQSSIDPALKSLLQTLTTKGSGDDCTVGYYMNIQEPKENKITEE